MFDEVAVAVCGDKAAVVVCAEDDAICAISIDGAICDEDGPACDKEDSACNEEDASIVDNGLVASNDFRAFSMRCCRVAVLMPYLSAALRIDKVFDNTSRIASSMLHSLIFFLSVLGLQPRATSNTLVTVEAQRQTGGERRHNCHSCECP
ncbi:hypothetical protein HHI36_000678 [Cryptolaemus montrouzieri]|uniref:Uncharacterized protein n=1 Tax=Cryptolaemus montrouzieri TaxID=559131 RepID=A0ABD2P601_9CUCU